MDVGIEPMHSGFKVYLLSPHYAFTLYCSLCYLLFLPLYDAMRFSRQSQELLSKMSLKKTGFYAEQSEHNPNLLLTSFTTTNYPFNPVFLLSNADINHRMY